MKRRSPFPDVPPAYQAPPPNQWQQAPPPAYYPQSGGYYGWAPPTNVFPDAPPGNRLRSRDSSQARTTLYSSVFVRQFVMALTVKAVVNSNKTKGLIHNVSFILGAHFPFASVLMIIIELQLRRSTWLTYRRPTLVWTRHPAPTTRRPTRAWTLLPAPTTRRPTRAWTLLPAPTTRRSTTRVRNPTSSTKVYCVVS